MDIHHRHAVIAGRHRRKQATVGAIQHDGRAGLQGGNPKPAVGQADPYIAGTQLCQSGNRHMLVGEATHLAGRQRNRTLRRPHKQVLAGEKHLWLFVQQHHQPFTTGFPHDNGIYVLGPCRQREQDKPCRDNTH